MEFTSTNKTAEFNSSIIYNIQSMMLILILKGVSTMKNKHLSYNKKLKIENC